MDDDKIERLLMRRILNQTQQFECVSEYSTGEAALAGIPQSTTRIVLMDIRMPGMSGIECVKELKTRMQHLRVVMVTGSMDTRSMHESRRAGADSFLIKPFSPAQCLASMIFAVDAETQAHGFIQPTAGNNIKGPITDSQRRVTLNSRESAVAKLISRGLRNKEIADELDLSVFVVENLVKELFIKLPASNRAEVASRVALGKLSL